MSDQRWYRHPEMIVALAAVVLSVFTVLVGAYSASIDRAYARASVWPRLEMGRSFSQGSYSYIVSNRGTGPALVEQVRMAVRQQPQQDWQGILDAHGVGEQRRYAQSQIDARTFSAGQELQVFHTEDQALIKQLLDPGAPPMEVEICYCSIYQQCWTVDQGNRPMEVERCAIPEAQRFRQ